MALLEHVRLTHTLLIFSEVFSPEEKFLLSFLLASHAGWLGCYSLSQTDQIENFFETVGEPVPCDSLLNPLWDELLQCVEDSWLRCDSFLRSAHTEYQLLRLPTIILPQSATHGKPRVPNIEAKSYRSHTLADAEQGPREVPVEGGSQSTCAIKIARVRSPSNNRICLSTRRSSAARQKGPEIQTPRRSSSSGRIIFAQELSFCCCCSSCSCATRCL